jgi:uncharacterized membrane protein HdeD (DUF308 family)
MQAAVYNELKSYWWLLLLSGILSILIGGALLFWPGKTLTVVGFLIGLWMLLAGVMRFLIALFGGDTDGRWVILVVGIVGIALGIVVMRNPTETIAIIVVIAAVFWIISGLVDIFQGISDDGMENRGWVIFGGVVAALAGAIVLLWPSASLLVLAVIAGVFFIVDGIMQIIAGFQVKSA